MRWLTATCGALLLLTSCRPVDLPSPSRLLATIEPVPPVEFELVDFIESRRDAEWGVFASLSAVEVMRNGQAFVADAAAGEIHRFDVDGTYLGGVDAPPERSRATDLAARGRTLFVLDRERSRLLRYSADGAFRDRVLDLQRLAFEGRIDAVAIDVDRDGRIAVADAARHQVILAGPHLELETTVGEWGPFAGQLDRPSGVAFGIEGILYVVDQGNRRLQAFDRTGFPLVASASVNDPDAPLVLPRGIATDDFGNVYVCDEAAGQIVVFGPGLEVLGRLGTDADGEGRLRRPVDCAVGPDDLLYVVDPGRGAVLVYRIHYA